MAASLTQSYVKFSLLSDVAGWVLAWISFLANTSDTVSCFWAGPLTSSWTEPKMYHASASDFPQTTHGLISFLKKKKPSLFVIALFVEPWNCCQFWKVPSIESTRWERVTLVSVTLLIMAFYLLSVCTRYSFDPQFSPYISLWNYLSSAT